MDTTTSIQDGSQIRGDRAKSCDQRAARNATIEKNMVKSDETGHDNIRKPLVSPILQKHLFGEVDAETSNDEDEDYDDEAELTDSDDDDLNEEERILQRMILRNFLGRAK